MPGLDDLYREIILDHYRSPRHRGELESPPARKAEGHNPLCGDEITIYLDVDETVTPAVVRDIKVAGQGCSISQSSASMMSQAVIGKTLPEVNALVRRFKSMLSLDTDAPEGAEGAEGAEDRALAQDPANPHPLGDLEALQGVVKFPVRIKCATLAWNTLIQALDH
jgi:nitrogen fixation protein NifU and related proteins